jgi:glycosyltransferase involved in cell wall biosynthesis
MKNRRVLYLCGQAPWLRNGGSMLRNFWMIETLAKMYTVDLVVADEPGAIPAAFGAIVDDYAAFPRSEAQRRGIGRLLGAARPGASSLTAGWTTPALRDYVTERVGRYAYAAIQVDLPMIGALPRRDAIPIVYNAHNCESALLTRRAATEALPSAALLRIDARRVRRQERTLIDRAGLVAVCSRSDRNDFARFAPAILDKSAIVPNGVDVDGYAAVHAQPGDPHVVLVTGSMDWRPNILGLRWFLQTGLAVLRARFPSVVVRVAGRMKPELVAELRGYPGLDVVANPESMDPLLAAATVVAVPIVASSGTRLRILEAWAAGRPVVTTTAGAFGLSGRSEEALLVRDDAREFADALAALLESPKARADLVAVSDQVVMRYDWMRVGARLLRAYDGLLNGDRAFAPPGYAAQS